MGDSSLESQVELTDAPQANKHTHVMFSRSALRLALQKAPLANGPLQAPTNLCGFHQRNWTRVMSKSFIGAFSMGLLWLWMVRIPNSEQINDYLKHVDLEERKQAMIGWGVFPALPTEWQKANLAKLKEGDDEDDE